MSELRFDMLKWQRKVFADSRRFKVVVAGRRCGKTRMSSVTVIAKALECKHSDAGVLYVAPTFQMARTLMWDLLLNAAQPVIASSNVNNGEIKLVNGVKIYIRGADNPDALRGMKLYYAVLDEFKDVKPQTWEMIVRPALSDLEGGALFIGTPEPGVSLFRDYFDLGMATAAMDEMVGNGMSPEEALRVVGQVDEEWMSWHFTTADNELINPREIEAARRSMSTFAFKQEYEASFDSMGADVFKEEWLDRKSTRLNSSHSAKSRMPSSA